MNTETWSVEINSGLRYAARFADVNSRAKTIRVLFKAGADINAQDNDGDNALMGSVSAYEYDHQSVAALLRAGADVEARNKRGLNALMRAIDRGNLQAVEALLKAGADPEPRNKIGETALICAARKGNPEIVTALLDAGAGTFVRSRRGRKTALMEAAHHSNPEVVTVLLKAGAKTGKRDSDGWTALMYAAYFGTPETVAAFLDQGVYETKEWGVFGFYNNTTAIDLAKKNSKLKGTDALQRLRISSTDNYAENQTRYGWTPLMHTIMSEQYDHEAVTAMLNSGVNIDEHSASAKGDTALIIAARYGRLEAVKALLEAGADPEAQNKYNHRTALMEAVGADEYNRKVIAALLSGTNLEAKNRALFYAVYRNKPKAVFALLKAGANIDARRNSGETPLMYAVSSFFMSFNSMKAAAALLKAGADVEARDEKGNTAITIIEERMEYNAKQRYRNERYYRQQAAMLQLLREAIREKIKKEG